MRLSPGHLPPACPTYPWLGAYDGPTVPRRPPAGTPLPEFDAPPVEEVALGIHFATEVQLTLPDVIQLRSVWSEYSDIEEKGPLPPLPVSNPSGPQIQIVMFPEPPLVRYVFQNPLHTRLIQIQRDRLVYSWRRQDEEGPYPHYQSIRPALEKSFAQLQELVAERDYGKLTIERVEVTYLNPIAVGTNSREVQRMAELIAPWSGEYSDSLLGEPAAATLMLTYALEEEEFSDGVLWISLGEAKRERDDKDVLLLRLTAHGKPLDVDSPFASLDIAHEWVIRGFKSITSQDMHRQWRGH